MKKLLTVLLVAAFYIGYGQTYTGPIVVYTFNGSSLAPTTVIGGSATNLDTGNGVTNPTFSNGCGGSSETYSRQGWTEVSATAAILAGDFYRFTYTAGPNPVTINNIAINSRRFNNSQGPPNYAIYFNAGANPVASGSINSSCTVVNPLTPTIIPGGGILTVRLVAFGASNANGEWRLDDVVLDAVTILPIELSYFRAKPQTNSVLLEWQTESESGNDFMAIERSTDGRSFTEIGRVQGAGTRSDPIQYQFEDRAPLSGINYYRLRQVDYDGATTHHHVVSVVIKSKVTTLFPTIANEQVTLRLPFPSEEETRLEVRNMAGQVWIKKSWPAGTTDHILALQQLPAGTYIVALSGTNTSTTHRFIKH